MTHMVLEWSYNRSGGWLHLVLWILAIFEIFEFCVGDNRHISDVHKRQHAFPQRIGDFGHLKIWPKNCYKSSNIGPKIDFLVFLVTLMQLWSFPKKKFFWRFFDFFFQHICVFFRFSRFHAELVILAISKFGRKMAVNWAKSVQKSIFRLFW